MCYFIPTFVLLFPSAFYPSFLTFEVAVFSCFFTWLCWTACDCAETFGNAVLLQFNNAVLFQMYGQYSRELSMQAKAHAQLLYEQKRKDDIPKGYYAHHSSHTRSLQR